jgi:hypothetical protein
MRTGKYFWWKTSNSSGDTYTQELPFFGDSFACNWATGNDSDYASPVFTLNGSALSGFTNSGNGTGFTSVTSAGVVTETGNDAPDSVVNFKAGAGTLGANTLKVSITSNATNKYAYNRSFSVATPIHTSSHYQPFETPYLHELVGGDRNMEQTNLVVTPDGKTWDEVTRKTDYLGPSTALAVTRDGGHVNNATFIWDFTRGESSKKSMIQKNIAIAYDRMIILEDGIYELGLEVYGNVDGAQFWLLLNSTTGSDGNGFHIRMDINDTPTQNSWITKLKRGDYLYSWVPNVGSYAIHGAHTGYNQLTITKLN